MNSNQKSLQHLQDMERKAKDLEDKCQSKRYENNVKLTNHMENYNIIYDQLYYKKNRYENKLREFSYLTPKSCHVSVISHNELLKVLKTNISDFQDKIDKLDLKKSEFVIKLNESLKSLESELYDIKSQIKAMKKKIILDEYYLKYVEYATKHGILSGTADTLFARCNEHHNLALSDGYVVTKKRKCFSYERCIEKISEGKVLSEDDFSDECPDQYCLEIVDGEICGQCLCGQNYWVNRELHSFSGYFNIDCTEPYGYQRELKSDLTA